MHRHGLPALVALAVLVPAMLFVASGVRAQSVDPVLVANTGQTAGTALATNDTRDTFSQSFTTGSHPDGYFLTSVELGLSADTGVNAAVSLWSADRHNLTDDYGHAWYPASAIMTLTAPASIDDDSSTLEQFSTNDVLLLPDTTYFIVVRRTAGASNGLSLAATTSVSVDAGGLPGFSLDNRIWVGPPGDGWDLTPDPDRDIPLETSYDARIEASMKIRLRGSEATRPPGPYLTNRNTVPWGAHAQTGPSATRYATWFTIKQSFEDTIIGGGGSDTYDLTSVLLSVAAEAGVTPRVRIHADSNGNPAANPIANGALTAPTELSRDLDSPARAEFTAPPALSLTPNTKYWVVLDIGSGSGNLSVATAVWEVGALKVYNGTSWSNDSADRAFRMAINGTTDINPGSLEFGVPQVGIGIPVEIVDRSGRIKNESWQWQRGDTSDGTFTDIPTAEGGTLREYVPSAADLGKWLKATVTYEDAMGPDKSASAVSREPVRSQPTVSNISQPGSGIVFSLLSPSTQSVRLAQAFTTGNNPSGYVLRGLRVPFGIEGAVGSDIANVSWALHANAGGSPAGSPNFDNDAHSTPAETPLFEYIAVPTDGLDSGVDIARELPHDGTVLAPNTKYWAVLRATSVMGSESPTLLTQAISEVADRNVMEGPTAELDPGSESGWALDLPPLSLLADRWNLYIADLDLEGKVTLRMAVLTAPVVEASFEESSYTVDEGDDSSTTDTEENKAAVKVTLSEDPERSVSIPITVTNQGGATSGDYSGVPSSVTFAAGETEKTITFTAVQDDLHEHDEDVTLSFGTLPVGVNAGTNSTATVSITDDDGPPVTVSFGAASYSMPEGGMVTVAIELNADPERTVTVPMSVAIQDGATFADWSVTPQPVAVTFAAGETEKTITFTATQDTFYERGESLLVSFGTLPSGVSTGTQSTTTVWIIDDDDPEVTVSFGADSYTVAESDDTSTTGTTENTVAVTVSLSRDPERTVVIPITKVEQGGATTADYSGVPATVTFASGETEKTITFTATHDTVDDDGESVKLSFGTALPDRVTRGSTGETTVTITDDDDPHVTVRFGTDSYTVAESDDAMTSGMTENAVAVTVELSEDPERTVVIPITRTEQDGATAADYSGVPATVTFTSGETEKTIPFMATHDTVDDDGESVKLAFGTALPARVTRGSPDETTVAITDDDDPHVTVSFGANAYTMPEGGMVTVAVALNADPERTVTIPMSVAVQNGATSADYSVTPDPVAVTFAAGETEKTITFTAPQDTLYERGENLLVSFGTLPGRVTTGAHGTTTVWITDDDPRPVTVSFGASEYWVGEGGTVVVKVELSADPERSVTVPITATEQGGATADDYSGVRESVTFATGETEKFFTVAATDDQLDEDGEAIALSFGNLPDAVTEGTPATTTISISDQACPGVLWCGTVTLELEYADADNGRLILRMTPASLDEDEFTDNSEKYRFSGLRLKHGPSGTGTAAPPFRIPERGSLDISLQNRGAATSADRWKMPNEEYLDWTLRISTGTGDATTEIELPFSDARFILGNTWKWYGDDLHDLASGWTAGAQYNLAIVNDDRSARVTAPPGPPLYVRAVWVGRESAILHWVRPQLRDDNTPSGVSYKIQWKLETSSWDAPDAVSGETYTPAAPRELLSWTIDTLSANTAYDVRVIAVKDTLGSEPSNVLAIHTTLGNTFSTAQQQAANNPPTGGPGISGSPRTGETLTADTSDIEDLDGLTNPGFTYQWIRHDFLMDTDTDIEGQTGQTYIVTAEDSALKVRVTFTDDAGKQETMTSYPVLAAPPLISQEQVAENSHPTGAPYVTGTAQVGQTLIVDIFDIEDADGLTNASFAYQWIRHDLATTTDTDIAGETGETYDVTTADEGKAIKVQVSFTDDAGNDESVTSAATAAVTAAPGLSLSDLDAGDGQELLASALIQAGDQGRKNDETKDRAWYATDTPGWHASGELRDGSLAWNEMTLTRVVYFADTGVLRFNEADADVHIGESFAEGGVNREVTIWVKTETGTVSFLAKDNIANSGSGYINFTVPEAARSTLSAVAEDDLIIVAVSEPDTS